MRKKALSSVPSVYSNSENAIAFIDRLCRELAVYPVTVEIARMVGRIEGQQAALGFTLAFEDLAIGVTAAQLGYDIVTLNEKALPVCSGTAD